MGIVVLKDEELARDLEYGKKVEETAVVNCVTSILTWLKLV